MVQLLFDTAWTGLNLWWLPIVSVVALCFLRYFYKKRTMEEK